MGYRIQFFKIFKKLITRGHDFGSHVEWQIKASAVTLTREAYLKTRLHRADKTKKQLV